MLALREHFLVIGLWIHRNPAQLSDLIATFSRDSLESNAKSIA